VPQTLQGEVSQELGEIIKSPWEFLHDFLWLRLFTWLDSCLKVKVTTCDILKATHSVCR
jgi:hypothetical protein